MRLAGRVSLFAVAALVATIGFNVTVARAQVVCGDNVTTKVAMTVDLACVVDPGFTVGAGGSVDMAGHKLTACAGCDGVVLAGQGAKLSNGFITGGGAGSIGVTLGGTGVHKVENIVVTGTEIGFSATSDKNKIKNSTAYATSGGFSATGAKNALSRCQSSGSLNFNIAGDNNNLTENASTNGLGGGGIVVSGNSNKLSRNTSTSDAAFFGAISVIGNGNKLSLNTVNASTGGAGLFVAGDENKISKTVATNSTFPGIYIGGNFNKLSKNAAYDNGSEGIFITGNGNNINGSNTSNNTISGIMVSSGDANSLKSNVAMRNGLNGVLVAAGVTNSSISKTVALGNADPDLQDDNANCDSGGGLNVWAKSVYGTKEAGGVGGHVCIQ